MESISLFEMRNELKRVLQSKHFAKAPKRSRFLEFVCEQTFQGNADKLNEYLVGTEVYERGPNFNANEDPIVRVQAHEIRRALRNYYESEGRESSLRIDLPSGHYVPVFTRKDWRSGDEENAGESAVAAASLSTRHWALIGVLAVLALAFLGLYVHERSLLREVRRQVSPPPLAESAEWFWKPFLPPARPPLIALPVHPLLRLAHEGDPPEAKKRGYPVPKDELTEFRDTIHFRELHQFHFVPTTTDFTGVGEALGLQNLMTFFAGVSQPVRVKSSRLVDFAEVKSGNTILLGGNQPWSGRIFLYEEGFRFHRGLIWNKTPRQGEHSVYRPQFDPVTEQLTRDYALVLMLPNERREERILLIYGIYTQGSQAAIEYVTNPERLLELRRLLAEESPDGRPPPYFQALLETTVENYVPGLASLVAVRSVPEVRPDPSR
jgi:hypothetical protein